MQEKAGSKGYRIVACNGRVAIMRYLVFRLTNIPAVELMILAAAIWKTKGDYTVYIYTYIHTYIHTYIYI